IGFNHSCVFKNAVIFWVFIRSEVNFIVAFIQKVKTKTIIASSCNTTRYCVRETYSCCVFIFFRSSITSFCISISYCFIVLVASIVGGGTNNGSSFKSVYYSNTILELYLTSKLVASVSGISYNRFTQVEINNYLI